MSLPQVGLEAVIENMAAFNKSVATINKSYDSINTGAKGVEKSTGSLGGSITNLGGTMISFGTKAAVAAAAGIAGLAVALGAAGASALSAGSDVAEMESKFDAVFKDTAPAARKQLDILAESIGRNRFELRGFAATLQDTFVPLGFARDEAAMMSVDVVKLSEDLASFNNLPTQQVIEDIQSALVGNTETLRKYGVVANQAQIEQEAINSGLINSKEELTPLTKAQAIYNLLLKSTTDAQGDALRTSGGWANQMRALRATITETWQEIGLALLPVMEPLLQQIGELARTILPLLADMFASRVIPILQQAADVFARLISGDISLADLIPPELMTAIENLGVAFGNLFSVITGDATNAVSSLSEMFQNVLPAAINFLATQVLPILTKAIQFVADNWEVFKGAILAVAAVLGGAAIVAAIAAIGSALAALISPIGLIIVAVAALGAAWNSNFLGIRDIVQDFWKDFRPILNNIFKWLKKNIPAALKALQKAFKPILDKVLPELLDLFNIILKWVKKNWPLIKKIIISTLDSLINAFKIFVKVVGAFWDKWGDDIIKITSFVFGTIFKIIKTNLKNILDFISAILKLITGDWKGAWEDITKITDRTMDTIRDIIEDGFNAFRSVISKIMGNILNIINNIWDDIERAIDDAIDDIVDTVRDGFNKLPSIISDMTSKMKNAAQAMMNGVINGITSKLSEIRNALTNTVSSAISSLLSDVTGGGISSMLRSIGQNIIGKIVDGINAVGNFASSLISKINSELQKLLGEAWNAAKTIGSNIVQRILDGISSFTGFVSSVRNKIGSWIQDIVNNLSSIGSAAFQVGREIVQRMLDGIGSMASKFIDWVRDKFNDWMGSIFSPIPAARHMGEQIVENVMDGIGQQENSFVSVLRNSLSDWIAQASAGAMIAITPELVGANALLSNITTPLAVTPTLGAGGQTIINNNTFQVGGNTLNSQMDMAQFEAQVLNVIRRNL